MKRICILSDNLVATAKLHYVDDVDNAERWFLLHDNDKKFRSNLVTECTWLHNAGLV
jgi:hypothetical protein